MNIGSQDIQDLKERLQRTRWPNEVAEAGWEYGIPLDFMKEIVHPLPLLIPHGWPSTVVV
ncbi:epoxide hydrolase N-terminal domain-containing protein [Paenibacillus sp. NPDC055715]